MQLVKKLLATLLVTSTVATMSACSNKALDEKRKEVSSALAQDADIIAFDAYNIGFEETPSQYIVKFKIHYDEGRDWLTVRYSTFKGYKNHKDYEVAYSVSREEYAKLISIVRDNNSYHINSFSVEELSLIQNIISNYDPISTINLESDAQKCN